MPYHADPTIGRFAPGANGVTDASFEDKATKKKRKAAKKRVKAPAFHATGSQADRAGTSRPDTDAPETTTGANKAAIDADEIGRIKGLLLDNPNADLGTMNPEVASAIRSWQGEEDSEYKRSVAEGVDYSTPSYDATGSQADRAGTSRPPTTDLRTFPVPSGVRPDPASLVPSVTVDPETTTGVNKAAVDADEIGRIKGLLLDNPNADLGTMNPEVANAIREWRETDPEYAYSVDEDIDYSVVTKEGELPETDIETEMDKNVATAQRRQVVFDRLFGEIESGTLTDRYMVESADLSENQKTELYTKFDTFDKHFKEADAISGTETGTQALKQDPYAYQKILKAIEEGTATEYDIGLNVNLSEAQKSKLTEVLNTRTAAIEDERRGATRDQLNESYTTRINDGDPPTRSEILSSNLSQERKDNLLALVTSKEVERRDATRATNYSGLISRLVGGEGGGISEHELNEMDLSDDQRADVQRQLDAWEVTEAERIRTENETRTNTEREALEVQNYDELVSRFLGGDPVSEYEIGNMQLNDSQRADLMDRFTTYSREQERLQAETDRLTLETTNYNDLISRIMNNEDIEEYELESTQLSDAQRNEVQSRIDHMNKTRERTALDDKINRIPMDLTEAQKTALRNAQEMYGDEGFADEMDRISGVEAEPEDVVDPSLEDKINAIPMALTEGQKQELRYAQEQGGDAGYRKALNRITGVASTADPARASLYEDFSSKIQASLANPEIPAPSLFDIERSDLSEDEKERLKAMLLPPKTDEQLLEEEVLRNDQTKATEDHIALYDGKQLIEPEALSDVINDVFNSMAGTMSEEQIVSLVQARLDGNNMHVDSATLLNTVADIGRGYFAHFEGTRVRPMTFVERKELEVKERDGSLVTATELDPMKEVNALFDKFGIVYQMRGSPEEAYHQALDKGATATEAYSVFKNAGGSGAPPQGKKVKQELVTTNADGTEDIQLFEITEEAGGYGHPFYADDVYNIKSRPGESEEDFWERAEGAEWLSEFKDPDSNVTYSSVSPTESDEIVELMISTLGKNLADSPEVANFLDGLERFQREDDFTKSDLRTAFAGALSNALTSFGGYDLDEEKRLMREQAREDYDNQLEEANRYFLVNGLSGSGQEQRQYEDLASNYQTGLRDIDLAISQKKSEYAALQVTTLTDSFASLANIDITEDKLGLEAEDLEERGRQFDASIQAQEKESTDSLALRSRELDITQTQIYETIRQFNKTLGNKISEFAAQFGLSEMETAAMLKKMNSDIVNQTRSLSSEIAQGWASITGVAGDMEGVINLSDLGVPLSEIDAETKEMPGMYLIDTDVGRTISQSFEALTGSPPTLEQLEGLVRGEDLTVAGIPTLESRQIATAIVMQNLDRMNKYEAISKENDLDVERFQEAKQQADRAWYIGIGDVSQTFEMSNDGFRDAKYQYDKMYDPLSPDPAKNGTEDPDLRYRAEAKAKESYMRASGLEAGTDEYIEEEGRFDSNWRQANEIFDNTFGNQLKDIAVANKFEEDKFARANKQADLQEEKYSTVWGALMGARESDPTTINLYDSNRRLWTSSMDYVNEYTDVGTSVSPEYYSVYQRLASEEVGEGMDALMADYDPEMADAEDYNALVNSWKELNPIKKEEGETGNDHRIRAADAIRTYIASKNARAIVRRVERGELRVFDKDNVPALVASLMDNPPPGLFDDINSTYGVLNDDAKREVLEHVINATVAERDIEGYRDPDTGLAIVGHNELGLDEWTKDDGTLDVDKLQLWWDSSAVNSDAINNNLMRRTAKGGALDGVTVIDFLESAAFEDYRDKEGEFRITQTGTARLGEFAGSYNETFGRNPTLREALLFSTTGELDLDSADPSVGYATSMNIRLVPENWIDNYNQPGQLEGIFALLNGGNVTPERQVARTSGWAKFGNLAGGILATAAGSFAGGAGAGVAAGLFPKTPPKTDKGP